MEKTTTTQTALKWGAIAGIYSIISSMSTYTGLVDKDSTMLNIVLGAIGLAIMVVILYFAYKEFKSQNDGFMSYGQGLGIGSLIGGVSGLMSGIFSFVYLKYFDASFLINANNLGREKLEEQDLSSEDMEKAQGIMEMFTGPSMVFVTSILGGILSYFIVSLIVAHFQKNQKSVFE